jgi:hypothetical protein
VGAEIHRSRREPAFKHTAKDRIRKEKESRELVPSDAQPDLLSEGGVTTSLFTAHAALLSSTIGAIIYHITNKYEVDGRCARVAGIVS